MTFNGKKKLCASVKSRSNSLHLRASKRKVQLAKIQNSKSVRTCKNKRWLYKSGE
jgi:hypothetical protein